MRASISLFVAAALVCSACGKKEAAPADVDKTVSGAQAEGNESGGDAIGVKECDEYLAKFESCLKNVYGVRDVALSVPTIVGRQGVVTRHEIDLWPKEMQGLRNSGLTLRQTLQQVLDRVR